MLQCLQCVCWIILWDKSFLRDSYKISFMLESTAQLNKLLGNGNLLLLSTGRCTYICEADSSMWHISARYWDYAWAEYEIKCLIFTAWWTVTSSCQSDANLNSRIVCSLRSFLHLRLLSDFSTFDGVWKLFSSPGAAKWSNPCSLGIQWSGTGYSQTMLWWASCLEAFLC